MNARGGEDPVGTGLETGADGGAFTRDYIVGDLRATMQLRPH
jgi:hypothetical protein